VISSNSGGIPELNIQGETGFLSDIGDVEEMSRNALFVLDRDNLPRFKANALKRAQQFDISRILPLYESYYNRILEKSAAKSLIS
jgi:glycosyltransferase involved in cell wall biosynthesis